MIKKRSFKNNREDKGMGFEGNIKKGAESGIQALRDGTNVVFSEVNKLLKISEKKIDINSYKKKIERNYTTLGELVHRYLTDGVTNPLDQADVREVLQNIYKYNEKIQALESEIEIIKSMKPMEPGINNMNESEAQRGTLEDEEKPEVPSETKEETKKKNTSPS